MLNDVEVPEVLLSSPVPQTHSSGGEGDSQSKEVSRSFLKFEYQRSFHLCSITL